MVKTKTTPHGGSSHRPEGMATARFTGTSRGEAGPEEQFQDAPGEDTENIQDFRKCWKMLSSQRKVNWVQVSPRVRQVTSQHRPQKEQKPLLRKLPVPNPPTHDQVQARIPPRLPPKTPPRPPPKTLKKKPHQFLLCMLKLTKQQVKPG